MQNIDSTNNSTPAKPTVLVALSSANELTLKGNAKYETGFYCNEAAVPLMAMAKAGYDFVFANPLGNTPTMDKHSDSAHYFGGCEAKLAEAKAFLAAQPGLHAPRTFASVLQEGLDQFAGFFAPGGHAPMQDLLKNKDLGQILKHFHEKQKPTALICHAPIALLSTLDNAEAFVQALAEGDTTLAATMAKSWAYAGYKMTIFSTAEEKFAEAGQLGGCVRFYPDVALHTAGGCTQEAFLWASNALQDRELITGQNPFSDQALVKLLIPALKEAIANMNR